ncbi:MAG: DNA translocase FtsK [Deltaproteobacteria bacterium]|nr:DNA translocase FtsK [Deltaproteobacteria bacterium]RLB27755.1 MAG: DNA translocase FtsK [Deltaproteobacteria bacterium]
MPKAPKKPPIKREIWGVIFLLLTLICGGSLLSFHPQDPLLWETAKAGLQAKNLFGATGANLGGGLIALLGFSSFWLVAALLYLSFSCFTGKFPSGAAWVSISLILLMLSFSTLISLYVPDGIAYRGAKISGGLVGFHIAEQGKRVLNYFGACALFLTLFIISVMVITRLSFASLFNRIILVLSSMALSIREKWLKYMERKRRAVQRKKVTAKVRKAPKREMTIVETPAERPAKPAQEFFSFMSAVGDFKLPPLSLLDEIPKPADDEIQRESLRMNALRLEGKLKDFGVEGEVVEIVPGPVITMYEFKPAPGIKISKVSSLADDLALNMRASNIRIVAPIPGKSAMGIEIPNNKRRLVTLKEILSSQAFLSSSYKLTIALGVDIIGQPVITDLTRMPHLLVAGATGTGKSVSINAMINSILYKNSPATVRFVMIDPKRIELAPYQDIPHLLHPVVNHPKEATKALRWAVDEMERRYTLLSDKGVRNIDAYNRKVEKDKASAEPEEAEGDDHLPYLVIIIDELADLMMVSSRQVEEYLTRLAQMARAAGIHLILATQRPSVDVLTGIIKANFPTRISFQVSSRVDSRTILDSMGAEHLLGDGDMLFLPPGVAKLTRIHGAYVSEDEVKKVTSFLKRQMRPEYDSSIAAEISAEEDEVEEVGGETDEKYHEAVELVLQTGQASISMVQRKLRVGYNRAARMIEAMEKEGIVGPSDGVKPREVFRRREQF